MYPNVQADYTVVPGVSMPTDTIVTLTDGQLIDIDDFGNVRGVLAGPPPLAAEQGTDFLTALGVILISAALNAAVAGIAFWAYKTRKTVLAPAIAVGATTAATGVVVYLLRKGA